MPVRNSESKVRINFELSGELAQQMEEYIKRGLFTSKPELIRTALRQLFYDLDEKELQRSRIATMRSR
jgi:Arc/MetJ-type ribon-helix-helix transcriptional regulator